MQENGVWWRSLRWVRLRSWVQLSIVDVGFVRDVLTNKDIVLQVFSHKTGVPCQHLGVPLYNFQCITSTADVKNQRSPQLASVCWCIDNPLSVVHFGHICHLLTQLCSRERTGCQHLWSTNSVWHRGFDLSCHSSSLLNHFWTSPGSTLCKPISRAYPHQTVFVWINTDHEPYNRFVPNFKIWRHIYSFSIKKLQ